MTRRLGVLAAFTLAFGCAEVPGEGADRAFHPEDNYFANGIVTWEVLDTTCPSGLGGVDGGMEWGTVSVEDGRVFVELETMPRLEGTFANGDVADVSGRMVFDGFAGEVVTCDVSGEVEVSDVEVRGETLEVLSSEGGVNCKSTARFTMEPSDEPAPWWMAVEGGQQD